VLTVPPVIGKYYGQAQLDLLGAGFLIAEPTWVLPAAYPTGGIVTADSDITADSSVTADALATPQNAPELSLPFYVIAQSLPAGYQTSAQVLVTLQVIGIAVVNQPGVVVPVP